MDIRNPLLLRKKTKMEDLNFKVVSLNFCHHLNKNLASFTFPTWYFYFIVSIKKYIKKMLIFMFKTTLIKLGLK